MSETPTTAPAGSSEGHSPHPSREVVLERYGASIKYYWKASRFNKRAYKWTRYWVIILGALVTLMAALSSSTWIPETGPWKLTFQIGTPVVAAILTILGGLSQAFQWGATWRDSVITAERLQKELDRIRVTPDDKMDGAKDLAMMNDLVLEESRGFFDRMLGRSQMNGDGSATGQAGASDDLGKPAGT